MKKFRRYLILGFILVILITGALTLPKTTHSDITTGLVGYWKFDDGSGTTAIDSSGSGNNGTLVNGPTWTTGQVNGALNFDGVDDYVSIVDMTISINSGAISLWVYSDTNFNDNYSDAGYIIGYAGDQYKRYLGLMGSSTTTYRLYGETNLNGEYIVNTASASYAVSKSQWNHIAVSFDSGTATSYVNGVQKDQNTGLITDLTLNRIGLAHALTKFTGLIDEVRVYNRALSLADVQELELTDTTPPTISLVSSSATTNSATITWTTEENSDSQVEYGLTAPAYGSQTTLDSNMVISHSVLVSGLSASTLYHYRVKSRDAAGNLATSGDYTFTTQAAADTTPPTPNPMTFLSAPSNASATSISMTATTASDTSTPINYLFTFSACASNGGTGGASSAWQSGTSYTNSGLQPNKCYGYTVTARDSVPNTGTVSTVSSTYTSANTPGAPTLSGATTSTLNLTNAENSNPSSSPTTYFAAQVVTTNPNHAVWLNQWINASGNPSATAVWLTDAQLDAVVLQGLNISTIYGVKVKARNQDSDETSLSAEGQGTTGADTTPPTISLVSSSATTNSATITWTTEEPADSQVEYGLTIPYGSQTTLDPTLVTVHSVTLTGLGSTYHYRVKSRDGAGNLAVSGDFTFSTTENISASGWAFSETIGWLSFNSRNCDVDGDGTYEGVNEGGGATPAPTGCPTSGTVFPYEVSIDPSTGNFSGYVWSDNIGWLSFNRSETSNPPQEDPGSGSGPIAKYDSVSGKVSGWMRALAALTNGGGWDGWMQLGDSSGTWPAGGNQISIDDSVNPPQFHNWAWGGSDNLSGGVAGVVGWISFNCAERGVCASYNYKVILGSAINSAPTATCNDTSDNQPQNPCADSRNPRLEWAYNDPDNVPVGTDPQSAYQIQIDTDSGFSAPITIDVTADPSPSNFYQPSGTTLQWSTTYYWHVRVKDSNNNWSIAYSSNCSFTTLPHAYPTVNFNRLPQNPSTGENVRFTDGSTCYDPDAVARPCTHPDNGGNDSFSWTWTGPGTVNYDVPSTPTLENPVVSFSNPGAWSAQLEVTDSAPTNYMCPVIQNFNVSLPLPSWKEIIPR